MLKRPIIRVGPGQCVVINYKEISTQSFPIKRFKKIHVVTLKFIILFHCDFLDFDIFDFFFNYIGGNILILHTSNIYDIENKKINKNSLVCTHYDLSLIISMMSIA